MKSNTRHSFILKLLLWGIFCFPQFQFAQDKVPTRIKKATVLTPEEAGNRLQVFRDQRLSKDFTFQFELEHIPRRGDSSVYNGYLWGTWNEQGPLMRARFSINPDTISGPSLEIILQNGKRPRAWFRQIESTESQDPATLPAFIELPPPHWYRPILPQVDYTPFDLLMPFTYWDDTSYVGPEKVKGRPAQVYKALPPANFPGANLKFSSINYALDDSYNALLRVQLLDKEQKSSQTFQILSFKKVEDEQWIVKTIDLINEDTRDKARFKVKGAKLHGTLPGVVFDPSSKVIPQPGDLNRL